MTARRFPIAPLEALIADRPVCTTLAHRGENSVEHVWWTAADTAAVLGVTRRTIYRWRVNGVDVWAADRAACAAGLHPACVWADWFDAEAEAVA